VADLTGRVIAATVGFAIDDQADADARAQEQAQ
jgi:hypothetical protein